MMIDIKKIFYEGIVPEALLGRVNVYQYYNIVFNTYIYEEGVELNSNLDNNELFIPTLMIKNKELFDKLLWEYVNLACNFYDDSNFLECVCNNSLFGDGMICKEKAVMALLFANATYEDFNDPINFLRKRIDFINNFSEMEIDIGYSPILKANLLLKTTKDIVNNETPSQFIVEAYEGNDKFIFPRLKYGISNDTVYIYAIQNEKHVSAFGKKINRLFYKIGEGFSYEENDENPKDITASFLVVLNMAINYFMANGYKKIVVPSILIERWNAKRMATDLKYRHKKIDCVEKNELDLKQDIIQSNLTNKLVRTFLRLAFHYNNIDILALPYEVDSYLHLGLNDNILMECNNALLLETGNLIRDKIQNGNIYR